MAFSSQSSSLSATPNITPLIDVLLVLLIIFMVIVPTAPHGLQSSVDSSAQTSVATVLQRPPLLVRVVPVAGAQHAVQYLVRDRIVSLPGLRDLLRAEPSRAALWIGGDPSLDYAAVVQVVAEGRQAGYSNIGLLARRQ